SSRCCPSSTTSSATARSWPRSMRDVRVRLSTALLACFLAASSSAQDVRPADKRVDISAAERQAMEKAGPLMDEAQRTFAAKDWDASIAKYAAAIAVFGDDEALGGWRDQAVYN